MDILLKSVCVNFFPGHLVTVGAVADQIARLTGRNITRVDDVHGPNGQHNCFVHFDKDMPEFLRDALGYNPEIFDTREGPIRVGLNQSTGLDPNTEYEITQFSLTEDGLYSRDFKSGVLHKWNVELLYWDNTTDNPFVVSPN
jgi:hypothetical protein